MKRSSNPFIAFIFCLVAAIPTNAQTKPNPATHKSGPGTTGATASNTTTTGTSNKSTISTAQPAVTSIDENVHRVPTKLVTMHNPAFKSTPTYARRKQAYDKNTDDTARRDIPMPDGSHIKLKMVKNPAFGNMEASIK